MWANLECKLIEGNKVPKNIREELTIVTYKNKLY